MTKKSDEGGGESEPLAGSSGLPPLTEAQKRKAEKLAEGILGVDVPAESGRSRDELLTELTLSTFGRNALSAMNFANLGFQGGASYDFTMRLIARIGGEVRNGDLNSLTDMLAAQAVTLDTMFTEFSRLSVVNIGHYPEAVDRYAGLAMKAQANCRVAVETLARVKRGGKQVVKVIHVHEGGQAVVADTVNTGGGRGVSARIDTQPQEQAADAPIAALHGPDPARDGMPLPSLEGQEAMSVARGAEPRSAEGQPERLQARRLFEGDEGGGPLPEGSGALGDG